MSRTEQTRLHRLRLPAGLTGIVCACLLLTACEGSQEDADAAGSEGEVAAESTPGPPTGADYHSTVIRARARTLDRMEQAETVRDEHAKEEAEFSRKE